MPATFFLFIIFIAICIAYGYTSKSNVQMQWATEAGAVGDSNPDELRSYTRKVNACFFVHAGQRLDSRDFYRIEIHGTCMMPRGINDREHWLVKPINKKKDIKEQIQINDVLLLYLADQDEYKIREFRGYTGENSDLLDTYRYDNDGKDVKSSRPHSFDKVMGVVAYRI